MELKLKLVTTSPGGWTKTKLMLFSTQVEVVVELKLELSLAILTDTLFCGVFILPQRSGCYTLDDLIFVSKVSIPNLSLPVSLEVAYKFVVGGSRDYRGDLRHRPKKLSVTVREGFKKYIKLRTFSLS